MVVGLIFDYLYFDSQKETWCNQQQKMRARVIHLIEECDIVLNKIKNVDVEDKNTCMFWHYKDDTINNKKDTLKEILNDCLSFRHQAYKNIKFSNRVRAASKMDYINCEIINMEEFYCKVKWQLDYYYSDYLPKKREKIAREQIKQYFKENIFEDLMKNRFHPKNIEKFEAWGFDE